MPVRHPPRTTAPARGARPRTRARRVAAAAVLVLLAAAALTACRDGQGLRDEGPSSDALPTSAGTVRSPSSGALRSSSDALPPASDALRSSSGAPPHACAAAPAQRSFCATSVAQ
ncbi:MULTISPECIES: hypothetical protein [unclassified Streptomyces]|uniref:hypothetical protein n=1 Tax=unclassified Streptomyces TaxID=2593676 RepID=UPI0036F9EE10